MKKTDINILIIEDDKTMRASLVEAFQRKGFKAVAVGKPDEAESVVKIKPFHAVISDVMLPGKSGVDLVIRLKENLVENATIVFISGIYKDRGFAQEAIKKTEALEYFSKPFQIDEVVGLVEKKLNEFVEAPKVDLHSLLATPFASQRERRKALDHVEELLGYDLPFVFCILMDSESSGHLNIVDSQQNIYGVTFAKGGIAKFDSEATILFTRKMLVQHGFITEQDLAELKTKASGIDLAKSLVDQGLMSPHVPGLVKLESTISEMDRLVGSTKFKINFVQDRRVKDDGDNVDAAVFSKPLHDIIERAMPVEWLKSFYSTWAGHPISLGPQYGDLHQYLSYGLFKKTAAMLELLRKEVTIEDLIAQCSQIPESDLYKALHFLMLKRILVFQEAKRVKNLDDHVNRLKSMHSALVGKNPIQVFQYFGLNENPKPNDVARIYKEFAKSHHPDTLPQAVSAEIKKLNHDLFSHVSSAYETLSNEERKQKFFSEIKQADAEKQIKSDELVTIGATALMRGQYPEALPVLEAAYQLYVSERSQLHYWWVLFKIEGKMTDALAIQVETGLRNMSQGMKKTPLWIFVNGLLKRYMCDLRTARNEFEKVLVLDSNFMDARRELANMKAETLNKKSTDLLTGDLSAVMKNLFKKKGA
jgi:ActR/RegA family two-component response regulator/tetratricopeptide (TPR) repeat protein